MVPFPLMSHKETENLNARERGNLQFMNITLIAGRNQENTKNDSVIGKLWGS